MDRIDCIWIGDELVRKKIYAKEGEDERVQVCNYFVVFNTIFFFFDFYKKIKGAMRAMDSKSRGLEKQNTPKPL